MKEGMYSETLDMHRAWASGAPLFMVGEWVSLHGVEYQVLDYALVRGQYVYWLSDGSELPHGEGYLRRVK